MSIQFEQIIATFCGRETSGYQWIGDSDDRFARKSRTVKVEPSAGDWEAYRAAKAGLEAIKAYEFTEWAWCDCNADSGELVALQEPRTRNRREWLESEGEWLERCRALRKDIEASDQRAHYSDSGQEK